MQTQRQMRILYMEQSHHKEPAKFYGPPGPYEAVDPVGSLDPYMALPFYRDPVAYRSYKMVGGAAVFRTSQSTLPFYRAYYSAYRMVGDPGPIGPLFL